MRGVAEGWVMINMDCFKTFWWEKHQGKIKSRGYVLKKKCIYIFSNDKELTIWNRASGHYIVIQASLYVYRSVLIG